MAQQQVVASLMTGGRMLQFPCICVPLDAEYELYVGEQDRKSFRSDDDRNVSLLPSVKERLIKSVNYWRSIGAP